jgi:integrase
MMASPYITSHGWRITATLRPRWASAMNASGQPRMAVATGSERRSRRCRITPLGPHDLGHTFTFHLPEVLGPDALS